MRALYYRLHSLCLVLKALYGWQTTLTSSLMALWRCVTLLSLYRMLSTRAQAMLKEARGPDKPVLQVMVSSRGMWYTGKDGTANTVRSVVTCVSHTEHEEDSVGSAEHGSLSAPDV